MNIVLAKLEMGKKPNPARTNQTRTQLLSRTEPNPKVKKMYKNPNQTESYPVKNRTDSEPKCHGSYSVLSLNEIVGTFTHFTVNEAFYIAYANQVKVPA